LELALSAYTAAAQRWPDEALPRLGIGNVHYANGDLAAAEDWYRRYLKLAPGDPLGTNNLATVLAERGACTEAMGLVAHALDAQQEDSPYRALLRATRAELDDCRSVDE
jgi:Flp pilus assembly protein TadD